MSRDCDGTALKETLDQPRSGMQPNQPLMLESQGLSTESMRSQPQPPSSSRLAGSIPGQGRPQVAQCPPPAPSLRDCVLAPEQRQPLQRPQRTGLGSSAGRLAWQVQVQSASVPGQPEHELSLAFWVLLLSPESLWAERALLYLLRHFPIPVRWGSYFQKAKRQTFKIELGCEDTRVTTLHS